MGWPPLKSTWDFFELGTFLKQNDPLKILRNKLNMKNIGTKSVNMSEIMVYLAMFSTTIDKILCFWVLIRWKWIIIFQSLIPSGTFDFFDFRRPNLHGCNIYIFSEISQPAAKHYQMMITYQKISRFDPQLCRHIVDRGYWQTIDWFVLCCPFSISTAPPHTF